MCEYTTTTYKYLVTVVTGALCMFYITTKSLSLF
jgi:hypothetical protein